MKVVLFCGGQGLRLREYSANVPKPMVPVGYRPMIWHLMKYYAHHGHKDFILCLGHQGDVVKDYFLNYDEAISNDFVLRGGGVGGCTGPGDRRGRKVEMLATDIHDWTITFVDTGQQACVGERLKAVQAHLDGEEMFLANYADNVSDVPLDQMIEQARRTGDAATFVATRPAQTFHTVKLDGEKVRGIHAVTDSDVRINGGYFVLTKDIWDVLHEGEELVLEPFNRLIERGTLGAFKWDGFWACMDTFKEKQTLDDLEKSGHAPWKIWEPLAKEHMSYRVRQKASDTPTGSRNGSVFNGETATAEAGE